MKNKQAVIVFDCGATNIRVVAIDREGNILASNSSSNQTSPDPYYSKGKIWDEESIWKSLAGGAKAVIEKISRTEIIGVCTTTFGVDGAPYGKDGKLLYPVISWACPRTETIMDELHEVISPGRLYAISGVAAFPINTIYKLFWLKKYRPDIINNTHHWLFMPSIISHHLCGVAYTDVSMAGTSMLCDHHTRDFSGEILGPLGVDRKIFPGLKEAGEIVGKVNKHASGLTGIPSGVPVFAAGHDTQFAIFGSGAGINEPVLSSGTWEILMVRTPHISMDSHALQAGLTTEFDAVAGLSNPGIQWIGSGILEWIRKDLFSDISGKPDIYERMIREAREAPAVDINQDPDFIDHREKIINLSRVSSRGQVYHAVLSALAKKTANSLKLLEKYGGFRAGSLLLAGGGSKNGLWNELRSEMLGIPVKPIHQPETTVMGAAMFAFSGAGVYPSPEEARKVFLK